MTTPRSSRRSVLALAGLAASVWAFSRAAPHNGHAGGFNSDEAIPQLMANAPHLNAYALYFWGQDRLGGWPYIFAWLLHRLSGRGWTAEGMYWLLVACLLSTIWPVRKLAGSWAGLALAAVVGLLAIDESTRFVTLSTSQPYAWQLSSLFWAWWLMRRQAEADTVAVVPLTSIRTRRWWTFVAPTALASLLSLWSSPLSALFLWVAAWSEAERIPRELRTNRLGLRLAGTVLIAIAAEGAIRGIRQQTALAHGWMLGWTPVDIDYRHLRGNVAATLELIDSVWIGSVAVSSTLAALWGARLLRREARGFAADLGRLALVCSAMAWIEIAVVVLTSWARYNQYPFRYLVPSFILWTLSTAFGVGAAIERHRSAPGGVGQALLGMGTLLAITGVAVAMPWQQPGPEEQAVARIAAQLPLLAPDGVLLGGYWGSYVFIDGTAQHALTPVVQEEDVQRTAWNTPRLKEAREVIVSHDQWPAAGGADHPAPFIFDHGELFALEKPRWLVDRKYGFSLYVNRSAWLVEDHITQAGRPMKLSSDVPLALNPPRPSLGEEAFSVELTGPARQVVLSFDARHGRSVPELRAEAVDAEGRSSPLDLTGQGSVAIVALDPTQPVPRVRLTYSAKEAPASRLRAVAIEP